MIDPMTDDLLSLGQVARLIPPMRGRKTHVSTIGRWIVDGTRTPGGEVVRLEAVRLGGRWLTTREALARYMDALTGMMAGTGGDVPPPRSPARRRRASERAAQELARQGV